MKAVNWNTQEDMTNMFWRQNISQMWVETEFKVSKDIASWKTLTDSEKETFKKGFSRINRARYASSRRWNAFDYVTYD